MSTFHSIFVDPCSEKNFIHLMCQRAMLVSVSFNNKVGQQTEPLFVFVFFFTKLPTAVKRSGKCGGRP
jgi:hypothetical protein